MSVKVKFQVNVPPELGQWFVAEAAKSGMAISALIAQAMLQYKVKTEAEKNQ